jgi:hypothetical protein
MTTYKSAEQEEAARRIGELMKKVESLMGEATAVADEHDLAFGFPMDGADICYEPKRQFVYDDGEVEVTPGGYTGWISSRLGC